MYRNFFGLAESPFEIAPNPRFYFSSREHDEAVATILHTVGARKGAVLVTGRPGVGKTLVGRRALRQLGGEARSVWLNDPLLSAREMLIEICRGYGLQADSSNPYVDLMARLQDFLAEEFRNDALAVLVVDDVHELSLEAVRLAGRLNNLEVDDAKLLQLVLLGRGLPGPTGSVLGERLYRSFELPALTAGQTAAYVRHRVAHAGGSDQLRYNDEALDLIYEVTGGVPRAVNRVAEFALVAAFAAEEHEITRELVAQVLSQNPITECESAAEDADSTSPESSDGGGAPPSDGGNRPLERAVRLAGLRGVRLNRALRRAEDAHRRLRSIEDRADQQLAELESGIGRTDRTIERAARADLDLQNRQAQVETATQQQLGMATSRTRELLRALDERIQHGQRTHHQARQDISDVGPLVRRLEETSQDAGEIVPRLEEVCKRAEQAEAAMRSQHAELNAAERSVNSLLGTARQQTDIIRNEQCRLDEQLESAGQVIDTLATFGGAEERLRNAVAEARGREHALSDAQGRALDTLSACEDHTVHLAETLEEARQSRNEAAQVLERAMQERANFEQGQQRARETLELLARRGTELAHLLKEASKRSNAMARVNERAKAVLETGQTVLRDLETTGGATVETVRNCASQVEQRVGELRRQCIAELAAARQEWTDLECRARESLTCSAKELETRAAKAEQRIDVVASEAARQSAALEESQRAIIHSTQAARRATEQLSAQNEEAQTHQTEIEHERARLAEQLHEASDVRQCIAGYVQELSDTIPKIEDALTRSAEAVSTMNVGRHELSSENGRAGRLLEEIRGFRQELRRDRDRAARTLRRSRRHLTTLMEADARIQTTATTAEEQSLRLRSELGEANGLLAETREALAALRRSHARINCLIEGTLLRFAAGERSAERLCSELENRQADARESLSKLDHGVRTAVRISRRQNRASADLDRRTRRLATALCAEKQNADEAAQSLHRAIDGAMKEAQETKILLAEVAERVPQLQRLAKLLHEIYFRLDRHIPDLVPQGDWEQIFGTTASASQRVLMANSARLRRIVDVTQRLFESTAERLTLLQRENERAAWLGGVSPGGCEQPDVQTGSVPQALADRITGLARSALREAESHAQARSPGENAVEVRSAPTQVATPA